MMTHWSSLNTHQGVLFRHHSSTSLQLSGLFMLQSCSDGLKTCELCHTGNRGTKVDKLYWAEPCRRTEDSYVRCFVPMTLKRALKAVYFGKFAEWCWRWTVDDVHLKPLHYCAYSFLCVYGPIGAIVSVLSPVSHKGLHQGWTQTSPCLQVIHFASHFTTSHVFFFIACLYSVGTQHGNPHPTGWPILFCVPTQEPVLATANTGKKLGGVLEKMQVNGPEG